MPLNYYIQPWMCLERCFNFTSNDIESHLIQIQNYSSQGLINSVSFEKYNLGPNGTLVDNNLTDVNTQLQSFGVERWPMISSYPYPPNFIDWMRQLFYNQTIAASFVSQCINVSKINNYTGMNVDWEPQSGSTPTLNDSIGYANFLNYFATEMHKNGFQLSVDVASWSIIWNWTLISETNIDYVIPMSTYTSNINTWENALNQEISQINASKLVVGLSTLNLSDPNNAPLPYDSLKQRFDILSQYNVSKIGIWSMPLQNDWYSLLTNFT